MKINRRLLLSFAALSLLPLCVTGWFAYYQSSVAIKDKIGTYSVEVMNQVSVNIQNELTKLENDSIDIAFSDTVQNTLLTYHQLDEWERNAAEVEMKNLVAKRFSFVRSVTDVQIFTINKDKINAYGDITFGYRLKSEYLDSLLAEALSRGGVTLWTIQDKDDEEDWREFNYRAGLYGHSGIVLARSFRSLQEGKPLGYILIRIDERHILKKYEDLDLGTGTDIFILDDQGRVISSRNPDLRPASMYGDPSFVRKLKESRERGVHAFQASIAGKNHLVAYSFIPQADWFLVSTIPHSYLNYESIRIGIYIAALAILCFLLALHVSFLVSSSISRPLLRLVGSMNQVKSGNFAMQIRDNHQDELGVVSEHFDTMVHDLKSLIHEVKEKETLKRQAELKALQAQINPHFLSNTLNTIRWLAQLQKADNISNVIHSLIQLLHASMWKGGELVTLREEIEHVRHYLNIMAYKYYDKFSVHYEIEDEVLSSQIQNFLLQPIVENALLHGIEPMDGHGYIVIKAYRMQKHLKISITDNGVGIPPEDMEKLMRKRKDVNQAGQSGSRLSGIGIWNVDQRIKLFFGEEYGLSIQSIPNLYTTIELTLPVLHKEETADDESVDRR